MTRLAYLVHDLNDAAVARRVTMLRAAGAEVSVAGFRRGPVAPPHVAGAQATDLGHTADARLGQRLWAVARHLGGPAIVDEFVARADVIVARNLESLALAVRARRKRPGVRLVYECLDIHRTLTGGSVPHRAIQLVEARLLREVDLVLVSSPAFIAHHFATRPKMRAPIQLVENKLLTLAGDLKAQRAPAGPPWVIGWFGMLRCRRSLAALIEIAGRGQGRVEVLIAGKPSPAEFADFEGEVASAPHCRFVGPYATEDLAALYGQCHFAWAIDWFEEGLNSSWLLPNRLYEAGAFGVVPLALRSVETGNWLAQHGAGLLLDDGAPVGQIVGMLIALDGRNYALLRGQVEAIPPADLIAGLDDCQALLDAIVR